MIAFCLLLATAVPERDPVGRVTSAFEAEVIHDGGQAIPGSAGLSLRDGDRIWTGPNGGASIRIADGTSSYVGPTTSLGLAGGATTTVLHLVRGEVQVFIDGAIPLAIETAEARATIGRGILRASATEEGARFRAERGEAEVRTTSGVIVALPDGQEVRVARSGAIEGPVPGSGEGWTVDVEEIRLAAAASASRRLLGRRVKAVNDGLASELAPDGRLASVNSTGNGTGAGSETNDASRSGNDTQSNTASTTQNENAQQPIVAAQPNTGVSSSAISLALGGISASTAGGVSGGLFSDAQQDSRNFSFPGNIHLVTAQSNYTLTDVSLRASDHIAADSNYWSIGRGKMPTSQVITTFNTGSAPQPHSIAIPGQNAYLIQFPTADFGFPDPAQVNATSAGTNAVRAGVTGLVGAVPVAPQVRGATPLTDSRAVINNRATFALGEFSVKQSGLHPEFAIRRSDQDRRIIKGPFGNDNLDVITPNPQVKFTQARDAKFFPEFAAVNVPIATNPLANPPTYHGLDTLRKAAFTTLVADSLSGYAQRTGQTRFVVDHQIIDITGYPKSNAGFLRSGHALPGQSLASRSVRPAASHTLRR